MTKKINNVIVCGVGGQGIILVTELISDAAMLAGYDVKKSEVHGMAQRGGSVQGHVRFGEKVYSPIIKEGDCDVLMGFEYMEAQRYLKYVNKNSSIIYNLQKIVPLTCVTGGFKYPDNCEEIYIKYSKEAIMVDALSECKKLNNTRVMNVFMLGILAKRLTIDKTVWYKAIEQRLSKKSEELVQLNIKAFDLGWEYN